MTTNSTPDIPDHLQAMWDACRDGSLSAEEQQSFEAMLAKDEHAAALWNAETQWLAALGDMSESHARVSTAPTADGFARSVVDHWISEETRPVVARIEPTVAPAGWRHWIGSVAAAIILVAGGIFLANQMDQTPDPGNTVVNGGTNTQTPTASPVSLLVANTKATDLEAAHPTAIKRTVSDAVAVLDPSNIVDLLEPSMPDPADFFEQLGGQDKS